MSHRTSSLAAAVAGLALVVTPAVAAQADTASTLAPLHTAGAAKIDGEYLVVLKKQAGVSTAAVTESAASRARGTGATVKREFKALGGFEAALTAEQLEALRKDPAVQMVSENREYKMAEATPAATQSNATWGLDRIDQRSLPLNGTYTYNATGAGVVAYVIDSGVNVNHTEFTGRIRPVKNFVNDGKTVDCMGHGTHVAGTIAGTKWGVAKKATIAPVRVFPCEGDTTHGGDFVAALDYVVANHTSGPAVANMSIQTNGSDPGFNELTNRVVEDGITVATAAGNSNMDACNSSPGSASKVINVAASDQSDRRASFSNYGTCADIFAPGVSIRSALNTNNTGSQLLDGTSMASPHVAGAAAMLLSVSPSLTPAQVEARLIADATKGKITDPKGTPNNLLYTGNIKATTTPVKKVQRWSGATRFETALAIAKKYPAGSVDTVYIVSGRGFADALAGSPAAARGVRPGANTPSGKTAPVLLSDGTKVPAATREGISYLGAKNAVILGGTATVPAEVETQLKGMGLNVSRIAGATRYATAAKLASQFPVGTPVYVASGEDKAFADALSGGALAGRDGAAVLLVKPGSVPAEVKDALAKLKPSKVTVLGGTAAVSGTVYGQVGASERLSGSDRYGTSAAISKKYGSNISMAYVASGVNWPDALAGSAIAGMQKAPVMLTKPTMVPSVIMSELNRLSPANVAILGGTAAVSTAVESQLNAGYVNWQK